MTGGYAASPQTIELEGPGLALATPETPGMTNGFGGALEGTEATTFPQTMNTLNEQEGALDNVTGAPFDEMNSDLIASQAISVVENGSDPSAHSDSPDDYYAPGRKQTIGNGKKRKSTSHIGPSRMIAL